MMDHPKSTNDNIEELIQLSKDIRNIFTEKETYSELLADLNFFMNFCEIFCEVGEETESLIQHLFKVTQKVIPTPLGDTLILNIENCTSELAFNSTCWSFLLQQETNNFGKFCSSWTLERPLTPGESEVVTIALPMLQESYQAKFKLNIVFRVSFEEQSFQQVFPCGEVGVDVLHLLTASRRIDVLPPPVPILSALSPQSESAQNLLKPAPPSCKVELNANKTLQRKFAQIFLTDSSHRGFGPELFEDTLEPPKLLVAFAGSEEVRVEIGPERIVFRTFSEPLLAAVKEAVLKRFQRLEGLELLPLSDSGFEELNRLQLRLIPTVNQAELEACYLKLRKVREGIPFILAEKNKTPNLSSGRSVLQYRSVI